MNDLNPDAAATADAKFGDSSDRELFAAAEQGDLKAFEEVVRRYQNRVYRLAYGMTGNAAEAEEVVQETFLRVFRGLDSFRGQSAPSSWIYRVAANSALMRLRSKRRKPLLNLGDLPQPDARADRHAAWPPGAWSREPEAKLLSKELAQHLEAAISKLPDKYRLVMLLRDVEGLTNREVAQTLGITQPTVKSRLHRSRLLVRAALDKFFERK